jgi:hypothetical protein
VGRVGEVSEVGVSLTVELKPTGEGARGLRRWVPVAAHEVIGADPSEVGNLISAWSRHAAVAIVHQTRLRRAEQVASSAKEIAKSTMA